MQPQCARSPDIQAPRPKNRNPAIGRRLSLLRTIACFDGVMMEGWRTALGNTADVLPLAGGVRRFRGVRSQRGFAFADGLRAEVAVLPAPIRDTRESQRIVSAVAFPREPFTRRGAATELVRLNWCVGADLTHPAVVVMTLTPELKQAVDEASGYLALIEDPGGHTTCPLIDRLDSRCEVQCSKCGERGRQRSLVGEICLQSCGVAGWTTWFARSSGHAQRGPRAKPPSRKTDNAKNLSVGNAGCALFPLHKITR